jgi:hypothetical protein
MRSEHIEAAVVGTNHRWIVDRQIVMSNGAWIDCRVRRIQQTAAHDQQRAQGERRFYLLHGWSSPD